MTAHSSTEAARVTAGAGTMKAIVQDEYGSPEEVLAVRDVRIPTATGNQVLVRVHAASIHVGDLVAITGEPLIARLAVGLRRPKHRIPGTDIAGTIVAVGEAVTRLGVGDEVFGWCTGAFAEYALAAEQQLVPKPVDLTFSRAAAVGVSACAALQLLRGRVGPGRTVLINGAAGGLGSYAVQIATALGADVTGVCSTGNVDTVRSLGAVDVVDYTRQDFRLGGERYDFILDNVANRSLSRTRRALATDGVLQSNNGTGGGRWFGTSGTVLTTAVLSRFTRRQAGPSVVFPTRADLLLMTSLIEGGRVTPLVGRSYPLRQAPRAAAFVADGHARGTVVLTVDAAETSSVTGR